MPCLWWLVSLLHTNSSFAAENVENNDQVILPGLETWTFWVIGTHENDYNKKSWQDKRKIFFIMLNWIITRTWKFYQYKVYIQKDSLAIALIDKMAEWLRRLTVNPLGSTCVGSNSIFVVFLIGSMVKWIEICSLNSTIRVQISKENWYLQNLSSNLLWSLKKK